MSQVNILATIVIKLEYCEEFEKFANYLVDNSRKEEGNISYKLNKDLEIQNKYYFVEEWKSIEAIEIHKATPHFIEFVKFSEGRQESLNIALMKQIV